MRSKERTRAREIQSWDEVPTFANEEEEDAFWGEHSLGDRLLAQIEKGPPDPDLPPPRPRTGAQPISVRVDADLLRRLKAIARERNIGYQTLLKQWLAERLTIEEARETPPNAGASHVERGRLATRVLGQSGVPPVELADFDSLSHDVMRHLAVVSEGVIAAIADVLGHLPSLPAGDAATRDSLAAMFDAYRRAVDHGVHTFRQQLHELVPEGEVLPTAGYPQSPPSPTFSGKGRGERSRRRAGGSGKVR